MITIYADVFFAVNLCMDFLLLHLTGNIIGRAPKWRLFLSSLVGGLYATITSVTKIHFILWLLLELAMAVIMIFIAFGRQTPASFLKYYTSFLIFSCVLGGICFILFLKSHAFIIGGNIYFSAGVRTLILGAALLWGAIFIIEKFLSSIANTRQTQMTIEIHLGERLVTASALSDTGNSLSEPITGLPVCIIHRSKYEKLLTGSEKIYIIPYKTISGETNIFTGIMTDFVIITDIQGKKYQSRCIIAPTDTTINKRTEAIISPKMLTDFFVCDDKL